MENSTLELDVFIRFKDNEPNEVIEYQSEPYNEKGLSEMKEILDTLDFTIRELGNSKAIDANVKEIYGIILNREDHEDGDADVLEEFSVSFK